MFLLCQFVVACDLSKKVQKTDGQTFLTPLFCLIHVFGVPFLRQPLRNYVPSVCVVHDGRHHRSTVTTLQTLHHTLHTRACAECPTQHYIHRAHRKQRNIQGNVEHRETRS